MKIPLKYLEKYQKLLNKNDFLKFKEYLQKPLRKCIRVNLLKTSVKEFKKYAKKQNWELFPIPWTKEGFFIDRTDKSTPLGKTPAFIAGLFYIQEASSMIPPSFFKYQKNDIILDFCASPGSKTTQISSYLKENSVILANEFNNKRVKALNTNLERAFAYKTIITQKDGRIFADYFPNFFNKILLDAPCSGESTIRKDKNALKYWNEKLVNKMAKNQLNLLKYAVLALKKEGELIYSTCTLSPEENEENIKKILEIFPNSLKLIPLTPKWYNKENSLLKGTLRIYPQDFDTEGFFIAKIKKTAETEEKKIMIKGKRSSPFYPLRKNSENLLKKFLYENFEIYFKKTQDFQERNDEIWLKSKEAEKINEKISYLKSGILIAEFKKNRLKLTNEGLQYFYLNYKFKKGVFSLSKEQKDKFLKGEDLFLEKKPKEDFLVCIFDEIFIGGAKKLNNKLKNLIPRKNIFN
jgi:16S rRNA (cytosine1407-C5)-methyltransferase